MSFAAGLRSGLRCQINRAASCSSSHVTSKSYTTTAVLASGSNKWSKIKHVKEKNDAKKGSGYGSLSSQIITAVRMHPTRSASPDVNLKLGLLLKRAKAMDVSRDKIEATLKKAESMGTAAGDGQTVTYEALGPLADNGLPVALIVECQTDSPGRTLARVKEAFNKHGVRLSSTTHMFQRKGVIRLHAAQMATFDSVFEAAVEQGAEDVREWDDAIVDVEGESSAAVEIICDPSVLATLTSALGSEPHGHSVVESQVMLLPESPPMMIKGVHLVEEQGDPSTTEEQAGWLSEGDVAKLDKMVDMLYDNADCTRIWSNVDGWPSR